MKKKKNLFSNNKHHIKNKNYLRKKNKYYKDQKFLRKFKKSIQNDEPKKDLFRSDPIKNFFFTPVNEAHQNDEHDADEEEVGDADQDAGLASGAERQDDQTEHTPSSKKPHNSTKQTYIRGKRKKPIQENKKNTTISKEYDKEDSCENKTLIGHYKNKDKQKKSIYSKEIKITSLKKKERELFMKEREAEILKNEQDKKKKKLLRIKKFKKLNKKTKKGQPVMKNIINHLLKKI
ncbi:hypothetical protein, conserved [Plasmodium gonderi]|uniref:Uncharacterized protein n=1 Tax=Plasmodium gonderi TaxID=77519 RepID=A0A1Y1JN11_PLAGO|nr:hypothetical protein, conserved [Plasmodium gonderi]GAW83630.1 hypothetical protein, conserved [Plasmodium gonderi]